MASYYIPDTVFSPNLGEYYNQNVVGGDGIGIIPGGTSWTQDWFVQIVNGVTVTPQADSGGSGAFVYEFSADTYSITFQSTDSNNTVVRLTLYGAVTLAAPVVSNAQTFASYPGPITAVVVKLDSSGGGGPLTYNYTTASTAVDVSTTVPTTGWQSSSLMYPTRGQFYHFWAIRGTGYSDSPGYYDRTDTAIEVPAIASGEYGLKIYDSAGVLTFGPAYRYTNFVGGNEVTLGAGANTNWITSADIDDDSKAAVVFFAIPNVFQVSFVEVETRNTGATAQFRIKNTSQASQTIDYTILRYG